MQKKNQTGAATVMEEVDRIYTGKQNELFIDDSAFNRRFRITSSSYKTVVVWNPWIKKSAKVPDLENDGYQHFICVETGNMFTDVIEIPLGNEYGLLTNFEIIRD